VSIITAVKSGGDYQDLQRGPGTLTSCFPDAQHSVSGGDALCFRVPSSPAVKFSFPAIPSSSFPGLRCGLNLSAAPLQPELIGRGPTSASHLTPGKSQSPQASGSPSWHKSMKGISHCREVPTQGCKKQVFSLWPLELLLKTIRKKRDKK
jgi:hypothetical protein